MRRLRILVLVGVAAVTASACKIPVPDGTIEGKTGCEIWFLEPSSPAPGTALDWFLVGTLVPAPVCDDFDPTGGA